MSLNFGKTPPKFLPTSIYHRKMNPKAIEQYRGGSGNSVVEMKASEMKKVDGSCVIRIINNCKDFLK